MVKRNFMELFCLTFIFILFSCSLGGKTGEDIEAVNSGNDDLVALESQINTQISLLENDNILIDNNLSPKKASNTDNVATLNKIYNYFLTGNVPEILDYLSDDFVFIHEGVQDQRLPFYNTWYGKEGFLNWVSALVGCVELNAFYPYYFVAEDNKVDLAVLEGSYVKLTPEPRNQHKIQNFHAYTFNEEGKLKEFFVISESQTVVDSLSGGPGAIYSTPFVTAVCEINTYRDEKYYKITSLLAILYLHKGDFKKIRKLLSKDIQIGIGGTTGTMPLAGQYVGLKEAKNFINLFAKQKIILFPTFSISENNKAIIISEKNRVNYHHTMKGYVSMTKKSFECSGCLSFQYDEDGKICTIYEYYDTKPVSDAYIK